MSCAPDCAGERDAPSAKAPPAATPQPAVAEWPPTGFPGPYRGIATSAASASDGAKTAGGGADGVAPSHCGLSEAFAARFWSRADGSGGAAACWPWVASRGGSGHGHAWAEIGGRRVCMDARRPAFMLAKAIPARRQVQHRCNNKPCCSPANLRLGMPLQNSRAARRDGLAVRSISGRQALAVFRARRRGPLKVEITGTLGVSHSTVRAVLRGTSWRFVLGITLRPIPQPIGQQHALPLEEVSQ